MQYIRYIGINLRALDKMVCIKYGRPACAEGNYNPDRISDRVRVNI